MAKKLSVKEALEMLNKNKEEAKPQWVQTSNGSRINRSSKARTLSPTEALARLNDGRVARGESRVNIPVELNVLKNTADETENIRSPLKSKFTPAPIAQSVRDKTSNDDSYDADYWESVYNDVYEQVKAENANDPGFPYAAHATAIVEEMKKNQEYISKYSNKKYNDDFFGQTAASYRQAKIAEKKADLYNDYYTNGREGTLELAQNMSELAETFAKNNAETLDDDATLPWISQTLAGYAPQFLRQTGARIAGGLGGSFVGAMAGNPAVGAAVGQSMAASADMYQSMRGQIFGELLEMGVDEATARAAANDEAIVSSAIEGLDALGDAVSFGHTSLLKALGKSSAKGAGKELVKGLLKYGINIGQEYGEEWLQEGVSVANERRTQTGQTGMLGLAGDSADVWWGSLTGTEDEDTRSRMHEAGTEGAKIALMMGLVPNAISTGVNARNMRVENAVGKTYDVKEVIAEGLSLDNNSEAHTIAENLQAKQRAGKNITNAELTEAVRANIREIQREESMPTTLEEAAMARVNDVETDDLGAIFESNREIDTTPIERRTTEFAPSDAEIETLYDSKKSATAPTTVSSGAKVLLGDSDLTVGFADGQAFVTNGKTILPSPANQSVFLPVNNVEVAKAEFGATESGSVGKNVSKLLEQSDFTPISSQPVESNIAGVGAVHVFTDDAGREIALKKDVAEYFEGYNLEATFRGGKPYAIKATDNDGNVAGVAMAVWNDRSGEKYNTTDTYKKTPYNVMATDTASQVRNATIDYAKNSLGYSEHGANAYADVMQNIPVSQRTVAGRMFNTAYEAGLTNLDPAKANLDNELQREAFKAGLQDFNKETKAKTENVKNVKSHGKKAGLDATNAPADVTAFQKKLIDKLCKAFGVKGSFVDGLKGNAEIDVNEGTMRISTNFKRTVTKNGKEIQVSAVYHALHELAMHRLMELAPAEGLAFRNALYRYMDIGHGISNAQAKKSAYAAQGEDLTLSDAIEEVTANDILELYLYDEQAFAKALDRIMQSKDEQAKAGARKFKQILDDIITKVKDIVSKLGGKAEVKADLNELVKIRDLFETALAKAVEVNEEIASKPAENKKSTTDGGVKRSIYEGYANEVEQWKKNGMAEGESFVLGTTGDVLQGLGAIESDIYMMGDKIKEILNTHPEMTIDEIKRIPQILENPILILKSRNAKRGNKSNTRLVIFGNVKGKDGRPVLSVLDLRPSENNLLVDDMQKVTSAYTKDNDPVGFVRGSLVVYADKKRTTKLLGSIGFQMPIEVQQSGYIGSISYYKRTVNINGEIFSNVFTEGASKKSLDDSAYMDAVKRGDKATAQKMVDDAAEKAFAESKVRDENGKLLTVYHGTVNEFTVFDRSFAQIEGDFGKGYYFTSNEYDVDANYANEEGADLKNKIERYAERLEDEDEYADLSYEERKKIAREKFITSEPNTITAYLDMKNPVYINSNEEGTFLDFTEEYNEETDEFGEPEGLLIDFVEALNDISSEYSYFRPVDFSFLYEEAYDGGMHASDAVGIIKRRITDELMDENGDLAVNEVIRLAFEEIGFDGIIDSSVYYKFRNMDGMDSSTTHYIVFNSNQIKSAEPVTYDDDGNVIPLSERFNPEKKDIRYSLKDTDGKTLSEAQSKFFANSKAVDENGALKVVWHGTQKGGFTEFNRTYNWYTDNKDMADSYSSSGVLYEGYVNITNPYVIDAKGGKWSGIVIDESTKNMLDKYGSSTFKEGGKWKTSTADIVAAVYDAVEEGDANYDGVIIQNVDDTGSYYKGSGKNLGNDYVTFASNQFKDIYNANPTSNPDIKKSLKDQPVVNPREVARLKNTIKEMEERHKETVKAIKAEFKDQLKVSEFAKTDKKALEKTAKAILKEYESSADITEVKTALDDLYTYMANGEEGNVSWNEVYERAYDVASNVLRNVSLVDDTMYQESRHMREYFRVTPIYVNPEYTHDVAGYESLNDFRKANFGRINLTKDGVPIDSLWGEISSLYPEYFPEDVLHPADMLSYIADALDSVKPMEYNPYSSNMRQATTYLANDIIERFYDLPQMKTIADKAKKKVVEAKVSGYNKLAKLREEKNAKIKEAVEQGREKAKKAVLGEKMAAARDMQKMRDKYEKRISNMSESQKAKVLRAKITNHANDLSKKLLRPTDNQHIPQKLQGAVAKLLECINLESNYTYDAESHSYKKNDSGLPTRRTKAFDELRKLYVDMASELTIDPDLMGDDGLLNDVIGLADVRIADMTSSELQTVWETMQAVEASITTANRMFSQGKFETISSVADALKADNDGKKSPYYGKVKKLLNVDMLTPETFFHYLGDAGDSIFRMMRNAQDKHISIMKEVQDFTRKELKDVDVNKLEGTFHTVKLGGEDVVLSRAQLMELYVLMRRDQAKEHILIGGILPDVVKKKYARAEPVRGITAEEIGKALTNLSSNEKAIAEKLQRYVSNDLSKHGNEASMQVYNYEKFKEKNYWTIRTNKQEVQSDIGKDTAVTTVANKGMTKGTKPHANNSVRLGSIFDTFATHSSDMATYAAWLGTSEDVNRIRNFVFWEDSARTGTVKGILDRVHGVKGAQYLEKLLTDVAIGVKSVDDMNLFAKLTGHYKASAVAANIRVVIQQPTAILRAMDMIGAHHLAAGTARPLNGWKKAKKYAPIAQWKDWGHFDINTGRQMKDVLFDNASVLEKTKQVGMWGASKADSISWGLLWNAVESETKANRKDLKKGSEEFNKAVAERFTEIIDHTQVVDGILQRSQIMRSNSDLTKMATSFMGEPTKQYNMAMAAFYDATHKKGDAKKKAVARLGRTAMALAISGLVNACAQAVVDGLRDDDKEKEYWEKWLSALTGVEGDEENAWDYTVNIFFGNAVETFNPLNAIPYAKDLLSIAKGYDVKRMDTEAITKTWNAGVNMYKAITGEGKYTIASASANLFAEAARLFGLPVANVKRDVLSIANTVLLGTDNYVGQYYMEKASSNMNYSDNKNAYMDILYNAYVNDREAYEIIYADMVKEDKFKTDGKTTEEVIASSMETRMKKAEGVEEVTDLKNRYLSPSKEKTYNSKLKTISSSEAWKSAGKDARQDAKNLLHGIVGGTNNDALEKLSEGEAYGLDDTEYVLYKLALEVSDADNNGSYSAKEKSAALDTISLGNGEIAYLWGTDQALEAYAYGIDMNNYADFKEKVGDIKGDDKKERVVALANKCARNEKEWLYFMGTEYSSYKKRSDYKRYFD